MKKILLLLLSVTISVALIGRNFQQKKQAFVNSKKSSLNTSTQIYDKHLVAFQKFNVNNKFAELRSETKQRLDSSITKKITGTYQLIPFEKFEYIYDQSGNAIMETENVWNEYTNQWHPVTKYEYVYDGNGYNTSETEFEWDDYTNQFISLWKIEYTNDIVGNPILISDSYRDDASSPWIVYWKGEYTYDINGNMISGVGYDWDEYNSQWLAKAKTEYTYNSNQNMTSDIYSEWKVNTSQWRYVQKDEYTYDLNENQILWMHYQWPYDGSNVWVEYWKYENTYDANGNPIDQIFSEWDFLLNQWSVYQKVEYTFNTNNELTALITNIWDESTSQWKPSVKFDYEYDSNGNTTLEDFSSWDENTSQWTDNSRSQYTYDLDYGISDLILPDTWEFLQDYPVNIFNMILDYNLHSFIDNVWVNTRELAYYYSEANVGIGEISEYGIVVFPVPAKDFIFVDMDKCLYPASIDLYNIQGKCMLSKPLCDNEQVSVQEFTSGIYMYILNTNNGVFSGKFVIK